MINEKSARYEGLNRSQSSSEQGSSGNARMKESYTSEHDDHTYCTPSRLFSQSEASIMKRRKIFTVKTSKPISVRLPPSTTTIRRAKPVYEKTTLHRRPLTDINGEFIFAQ
ncbi:unnamed protein product, partial [Didymodactylos carnosus]